MEKLYGHILDNLNLKNHAAKYFLLLQVHSGQPNALVFSFADDVDQDNEFSLKTPERCFTDAELRYRITEVKKRLNSRCKGMLSLSFDPSDFTDRGIIHYCHRSAKDYLELGSTQGKLISMLDGPFDPHLILCSAYLAQLKYCANLNYDSGEGWHARHVVIYNCTEHAAKVASESNDMMIRILDEVGPRFEANSQTYILLSQNSESWFRGNFLSLTVALGVGEYVKCKVGQGQGCVVRSLSAHMRYSPEWDRHRIVKGSIVKQQWMTWAMGQDLYTFEGEEVEWPLLMDALLAAKQPNPEMVSLLLENGADPNFIIQRAVWKKSALDSVVFHLKLDSNLQVSELPDAKKAWVDSLCLLLRYGAKPARSDVQFLRKFIGEDVIHALKLPRMDGHRDFISKHASLFGWVREVWESWT